MNIYNFIYRFKNYCSLLLAYTKSLFFYLGSFSWIKRPKLENIKKILIIKQGGLGDTIICYDFVMSIKNHFKTAEVLFYCNSEFSEHFKDTNVKLINNISEVNDADIIFDLSSKDNSQIYPKIAYKFLFLRNPVVASDFLTLKATKIFKPLFNQHITNYYTQILKELNIKEIKKYRTSTESKYVVLNLIAAKKIRYIPETLATDIIKYFQDLNYKIYLPYYGKPEKEYVNLVLKKCNNNNLKLFDMKTKSVPKLIRNSKIIITTDTGIAHLAGYYNKKNIVIFGPGSKIIWKPLGKETYVVNSTGCQGCQRHSDTWKCNHECLENIKLKDIISKINV